MGITREDVLRLVEPVTEPLLGRGIVALDLVKNVEAKGEKVTFDIELPTPVFSEHQQLKSECERRVGAADGVKTVQVGLKAVIRGAPTANRTILTEVKNIIAVASGKGGVAKSTTAVNLALALAQAGARVGILDADIYGPSIPMMLTIDEEPSMGAGQRINPALAHGMRMISMGFFVPEGRAAILRGPMVSGYVGQFLSNVEWSALDYLFVDYPPGTGDIQLTLSQQAPVTGAVVCTTPQEISLLDVTKAVSMFDTTEIPVLGVVETLSYFICDGCNKRHDIFRRGGGERIARLAGVPLLAEVPIDPRVAAGGDQGRPILDAHPDSPVAAAYRNAARAIAVQLAALNVERGSYLETFSLKWDPS